MLFDSLSLDARPDDARHMIELMPSFMREQVAIRLQRRSSKGLGYGSLDTATTTTLAQELAPYLKATLHAPVDTKEESHDVLQHSDA